MAAVQLVAQPADINLHEIGAGIEIIFPDPADNIPAAHHPAIREQEAFQQENFTDGQVEPPAGPSCLAGCRIECQVRDRAQGRPLSGIAADKRAQAREEF